MNREELLGRLRCAGASEEMIQEVDLCVVEEQVPFEEEGDATFTLDTSPLELTMGLFTTDRNDDNDLSVTRTHWTLTRFSLKNLLTTSAAAIVGNAGFAAVLALFAAILSAIDSSRTVTRNNALVALCIYIDIRKHRDTVTVFSVNDLTQHARLQGAGMTLADISAALVALERSKMIKATSRPGIWHTVDDVVIDVSA